MFENRGSSVSKSDLSGEQCKAEAYMYGFYVTRW